MSSASDRDVSRETRELFAAFAARSEAGERVDIEDEIAKRPELGEELRGLYEGWRKLDRLLGSIRVDSSVLDSAAREASSEAEPLDEETRALLERLKGSRSARDRYEIREHIASGGMGEVLRVHDRDLGRDLAMKVARSRTSGARFLRRFMSEARLTARLDHPGIVPVHDVGVDAEGRLWFTMPLVRGWTLAGIFDLARRGERGWTRARTLEVLLRVCDTLEFAHAAGVVHRDLKPSNVMVGDFGETYVVDWGLARSAGASDDEREGDVVGTPAYMAPEQALALPDLVGPRADVYSVGALLYHLLTGHRPYPEHDSGDDVLAALRAGPPAEVEHEAPDAPAELVAVCRKAMARDPGSRYEGVGELSRDLRAWMERRVVRAYESGAWPELKKWVSRNRALAAALGAVLVLGVGGLAAVSWVQAHGKAEILRLADVRRLEDLETRAESLWPATPEKADAMERWLADAGALLEHLGTHERTLADIDASTPADAESRWRRDVLSALVGNLRRLGDPDPAQGGIASVRARLDLARTLRARSLEQHAAGWEAAVAALQIAPQLGLVPLGPDPRSGLWEFAHLASGEPARRGPDGSLVVGPETGLVLVLMPGGAFEMGSQVPIEGQPSDTRTDPLARENEKPAHTENVASFFLSKYEMTRAQWRRVAANGAAASGAGDALLPAGMLSRPEADRAMLHLGLRLPSEIEWEYAARAATSTRWWTGNDADSLVGAENAGSGIDASRMYNDGWADLAPVNALRANPWGLHHVLGNVAEWTSDCYRLDPELGVVRGGSFRSSVRELRAASKNGVSFDSRSPELGLRPARAID
ncbi:MAG TPA: bifunctional serine/threonine-protein kinase/formylglycine-generating enzyme family protein [Planctomycetota bacterium]|jgi:formylglycine-generating enzyme required for sulfatase activity|nr:bifunctional serine/threonine-protein kinase/formylglycine-generating enzyme family protein [Planctomycetota bacterium]